MIATDPKYDTDMTNKHYVDNVINNVVTQINEQLDTDITGVYTEIDNLSYSKNFGSQPTPPYYVNDTWMDGSDIYRCTTERLIGSYNAADWTLESTFTTVIGSINASTEATVIDKDKIYSVLQYITNTQESGEFGFIGATPEFDGGDNEALKLVLNAYIPSNFTITEAKILYYNIPVYWSLSTGSNAWGWVRAMKAYKVTNVASTYYVRGGMYSEYDMAGIGTESEITAAFGSGYTPSEPTTSSHSVQSTTSGDIKASLSSGMNRIVLGPASIPTTNGTYETDEYNCARVSSCGYGILTILGYYTS